MMRTVVCLGLTLLAAGSAPALELKNVRPCYNPPFLGATRTEVKCLPGDVLFLTYDIDGLMIDAKTGKVSYQTVLEILDASNRVIFKKENPPNEAVPQLGGATMPGDLQVQMPLKHPAGKYVVRMSVTDRNSKEAKAFTYPFEVLPEGLGLVGVTAPGVGVAGTFYYAEFAVVHMKLDDKKMPNVVVGMRVVDRDTGKTVHGPVLTNLPKDLPMEIDLSKENFAPMRFPIFLNRPGRFIVDIVADDRAAKQQVRLVYPLRVLDIATLEELKK